MRVVVVGGGVIGLCCAYYLSRAGADVTVIEAGRIGSGASHGNAGWIVPSLCGPLPGPGLVAQTMRSMRRPDSPVYIKPRASPGLLLWLWRFWRHCNERDHLAGLHATAKLAERTMALYDELSADGVNFEMHARGLLYVFRDETHARETLAGLEPMRAYGYRLPTLLSGSNLRAMESALSDEVAAGFLIEGERHVDPAGFVSALGSRLRAMGVVIREGAPATGFEHHGGRVSAVRTSAGAIEAAHVVLAAGSWTPAVGRLLGVRIPIEAGKGYSFSISPPHLPSRPLYLAESRVGCTPIGGRLRVAGTMELSGVNLRIYRRRIDAMVLGARRYLAGWDGAGITDLWTGMRPVSPDGLPIMGPAPGFANLTISTAHSMLGVTLAPASGKAIAQLVTSGRTPAVLGAFAPDRFRRTIETMKRRSP